MEIDIPILDTLYLNTSKTLKSKLNDNETVYFSAKIKKHDSKGKSSTILMITNHKIYNVSKSFFGKYSI